MTTHGLSRGSPRGAQPCRPCVTVRTLIGGSAHQTRIDFGLWEELVIAGDLTGEYGLPPAFRRTNGGEVGIMRIRRKICSRFNYGFYLGGGLGNSTFATSTISFAY